MSSSSSSKSTPHSPQTAGGMRSRAFKTHSQGPVASKSDWLAPTIVAARMITAASECLPFPYVKGAFGMVVILLETVEKVKKNRDDLKELCTTAMEIMCCEAEGSVLGGCDPRGRRNAKETSRLRAHIKEFVNSSSIQDKIVEYQKNIQEICSRLKLLAAIDTNFQVHKINATLATVISPSNILISIVLLRSDLGLSDITVVQAARQMNNCPPPSRIFQGRQTILDKMNQFFAQDIGKQHIYVLHGLGGAGKTQIGLRFINLSQCSFSDKFFLDASTAETVETALKNIASEDDGLALLLKSAAQDITPVNERMAAEIVKAGAFISQSGALNSYLDIYMKNRAQLLSEKPAQSHDGYEWTVYTTWQMSFEQLSEPAATVLVGHRL
ncbi:hypothetical protein B0H13DRAFT_1881787 [Mycena leptocephala]|nr:hypothetical protein B0H13DRAFT_1881787 [Mycena leptocephala]